GELIAVIRQNAAQRSVTNHLLKDYPPIPVQPRKHELDWFDTHDGGLPPITTEDAPENGTNGAPPPPDVVDAEWVMEVSQRPRRGPRRPRQRRQQKKAGAGWALRAVIAVALRVCAGGWAGCRGGSRAGSHRVAATARPGACRYG